MYKHEILKLKNPILKKGEFVILHDNDDGREDEQYIKIGDGVTPFNDLPYGMHYGVETERFAIVPEQSVTGEDLGDSYQSELPKIELNGNTEYIVMFNGKEYRCTAVDDSRSVYIDIVVGDDNYSYVAAGGDSCYIEWTKNHGETITLAIYGEQEVVQQIDPKFVGASGGGGEPIIFTLINDPFSLTCNKTIEQVEEDCLNGNFNCYIKQPNDGLMQITIPTIVVVPDEDADSFMFGAILPDGTGVLYSPEGLTLQSE